MAHLMKHNKAACGHLFSHYDRAAGDSISNENIDHSKTPLNYNLAADLQPKSQGEFVAQRCSEVRCQNRKDVNVMCSWVITKPENVPEEESEKFFQESFNFLCNRYGKENVVSAWVHKDEKTDHMHFAFVPVVFDKKKNREKVSAKEAVNRTDLASFHQDLSEHLQKAFGRDVGILNEATKAGNKTVAQLKLQTAAERVKAAEERAAAAEQRAEIAEKEAVRLKSLVRPVEAVEAIQGKKGLFNSRTLSEGDFQALKGTASATAVVHQENSEILDEKEQLLAYVDELVTDRQLQFDRDIKFKELSFELEQSQKLIAMQKKQIEEMQTLLLMQQRLLDTVMNERKIVPKFVKEKEFLAAVSQVTGIHCSSMNEWSNQFSEEHSKLTEEMQHLLNSENYSEKVKEKLENLKR